MLIGFKETHLQIKKSVSEVYGDCAAGGSKEKGRTEAGTERTDKKPAEKYNKKR